MASLAVPCLPSPSVVARRPCTTIRGRFRACSEPIRASSGSLDRQPPWLCRVENFDIACLILPNRHRRSIRSPPVSPLAVLRCDRSSAAPPPLSPSLSQPPFRPLPRYPLLSPSLLSSCLWFVSRSQGWPVFRRFLLACRRSRPPPISAVRRLALTLLCLSCVG